jgi:UDP-glucose 4-epimerase
VSPRAFVTGGAGFIGSHVVERLLEDGYEVTAFDNFSEGRMENIAHLKNERRFKYCKGDLKDEKVVAKVLKEHDVVFHLAAHANIRTSLVDHRADLDNNLVGTLNILEAMTKYHIRDLVLASTSAVVGEASVRPTPETYVGIQNSLYGASKLACEAYSEAFTEFADIKFWAFRFSNVVGERCRKGVIWDFVHKLMRNPKELEILGDGKQDKEYIYVKDCIDGIMTGYTKLDSRVNILNLAVEDNKTVDQVADIVTQEMRLNNVKRTYTGGPRGWIGDIPVVHLDISRIKGCGWSPRFSAEQAIRKTVRWTIQNP